VQIGEYFAHTMSLWEAFDKYYFSFIPISFFNFAMFYIMGGMSRNSPHFYNEGSKRGQNYNKSQERPKLWGCKDFF